MHLEYKCYNNKKKSPLKPYFDGLKAERTELNSFAKIFSSLAASRKDRKFAKRDAFK